MLGHEATEHSILIDSEAYHLNGDFVLNTIAGHRDSSGSLNACSGTLCPGDSFYPMLPSIRTQVSELPCYMDLVHTAELSKESKIYVYPNPVQHILFVQVESDENEVFKLVDIHGKVHMYLNSNQANNLQSLRSGVYFLLKNGELIEKVVKN